MLEAQKIYLDNLIKIRESIQSINVNPAITEKLQNMEAIITDTLLIVPVIGAFSAGKSSLINSFLGTTDLSVGITPETALATELHYATDNKVEAIKVNGEVEEYEIDGFDIQKLHTPDYLFLRYFLHNQRLQEIAPLVLVDMPGFDSPLDTHNKAIMSYLSRAVHFVVLVSVEDGTLPRSVLRQLLDLQALGHSFDFLLTKTNLRSSDDVQAVVREVSEQLQDNLGTDGTLIQVDDHGGESLASIIRKNSPDILFKQVLRDKVLDVVNDVFSAINSRETALGNEHAENKKIIAMLSDKISAMQRKTEELKNDIQEKADDFNQNRIIEGVSRDLNHATSELISLIANNNQVGAERLINDTVRSCLITHLKDFTRDIDVRAMEGFAVELGNMHDVSGDAGIKPLIIDKLSGFLTDSLQRFLKNSDAKPADSTKIRGSFLSATNWLTSIIGLLTLILPDILKFFIADHAKSRQQEAVRQKLNNEVFPAIKSKLRQELPGIINEQAAKRIDAIGQMMKEKLTAMQTEFSRVEEENRENITNLEQEMEQYTQVRLQVSKLAQAIAVC